MLPFVTKTSTTAAAESGIDLESFPMAQGEDSAQVPNPEISTHPRPGLGPSPGSSPPMSLMELYERAFLRDLASGEQQPPPSQGDPTLDGIFRNSNESETTLRRNLLAMIEDALRVVAENPPRGTRHERQRPH